MNSDIFGLWSIWQSPGSNVLTSLVQHGFAGGYGVSVLDEPEPEQRGYQVVNGCAVLQLVGPLMKHDGEWFGGTSTTLIREQLAAAVGDPSVTSIALLIDSPGGTVSGTKDLADDVASASQQKPLYAYCQDICCSAAYWIGSQATKLFANPTAIVGSIGTFITVTDYSGYYDSLGIKVNMVKAGEFKGTGTPGTPVTPEQLEQVQTMINSLNELFVRGAAQGRKMPLKKMKEMADGRAFIASTALEMGLIDGVQSFDETVRMIAKAKAPRRSASAIWNEETGIYEASSEALEQLSDVTETITMETNDMSEAAQNPATLAQLKDACPGASADFLMAQMEASATVDAAGKAWTAKLSQDLATAKASVEAAKAEVDAAKAETAAAKAKQVGVEPLGDKSVGATGSAGADPIAAFEALKAEYSAKFKDPAKAMRALVSDHADAHAAFMAAYTAANPYKRRA